MFEKRIRASLSCLYTSPVLIHSPMVFIKFKKALLVSLTFDGSLSSSSIALMASVTSLSFFSHSAISFCKLLFPLVVLRIFHEDICERLVDQSTDVYQSIQPYQSKNCNTLAFRPFPFVDAAVLVARTHTVVLRASEDL